MLTQRLHEVALAAANRQPIEWTGFAELNEVERVASYVSCFSNCLSTRANCLSPTLVVNMAVTEGVPLAPIR